MKIIQGLKKSSILFIIILSAIIFVNDIPSFAFAYTITATAEKAKGSGLEI